VRLNDPSEPPNAVATSRLKT
jgi:hypothetical protein